MHLPTRRFWKILTKIYLCFLWWPRRELLNFQVLISTRSLTTSLSGLLWFHWTADHLRVYIITYSTVQPYLENQNSRSCSRMLDSIWTLIRSWDFVSRLRWSLSFVKFLGHFSGFWCSPCDLFLISWALPSHPCLHWLLQSRCDCGFEPSDWVLSTRSEWPFNIIPH